MALNSINPTQTKAWDKLKDHFEAIKDDHMKTWFEQNPAKSAKSLAASSIAFSY